MLECWRAGLSSVSVDLNPVALAISRAKATRVDADLVGLRISDLRRSFDGDLGRLGEVPDAIKIFFHERTLAQMCFLREVLDERAEDVFIRGCVLGIMHGKWRGDGTSMYLSIDMPNTFSMSPGYVQKFVAQRGLEKRPTDVFSALAERVQWLLRDALPENGTRHQVLDGDAGRIADVLRLAGVTSIDGVITSPPYMHVLRYGAFNWIRLWFEGYSAEEVDSRLQSSGSLDRYLNFILNFLSSLAEVLKPGGKVALVIGDIEKGGRKCDLAEAVWSCLAGVVPYDLEEKALDSFDQSVKTTRIWGESRRGRATPRDRILVLSRSGAAASRRTSVGCG